LNSFKYTFQKNIGILVDEINLCKQKINIELLGKKFKQLRLIELKRDVKIGYFIWSDLKLETFILNQLKQTLKEYVKKDLILMFNGLNLCYNFQLWEINKCSVRNNIVELTRDLAVIGHFGYINKFLQLKNEHLYTFLLSKRKKCMTKQISLIWTYDIKKSNFGYYSINKTAFVLNDICEKNTLNKCTFSSFIMGTTFQYEKKLYEIDTKFPRLILTPGHGCVLIQLEKTIVSTCYITLRIRKKGNRKFSVLDRKTRKLLFSGGRFE